MKERSDSPPPDGFVLQTGRGPFTSHNGPFYHRPDAEEAHQAFLATERHCNSVGLVHGGMLSAFMDGLLAYAAGRGASADGRAGPSTPVTVNLNISFLQMGRAGEWVIGEARATRVTRDMVFVEGRAHVGPRDLVRASGVFKLMRRQVG